MSLVHISAKDSASGLILEVLESIAKLISSTNVVLTHLAFSKIGDLGNVEFTVPGLTNDLFQKEYKGCTVIENPEHNFNGISYALTVINSGGISVQQLLPVFQFLNKNSISTYTIQVLSEPGQNITALDVSVCIPQSFDTENLRSSFYTLSTEIKADIGFQKNDVFRQHKRLFVFDMDSTLIQQECIDEIARIINVVDEVSKITERAMRGELDFKQSFRHRVNLLKGASRNVFDQVRERITFTPGVVELTRVLKRLGVTIAVVSGGFQPLVDFVKDTLGLDFGYGNLVEIDSNGTFTGQVIDPIVDGERKAQVLRQLANSLQLRPDQIVAVGDGANDLMMMEAAGLGIAFNAKPKVQQLADMRINQPSLLNVLYYMGFTFRDIQCVLEDR